VGARDPVGMRGGWESDVSGGVAADSEDIELPDGKYVATVCRLREWLGVVRARASYVLYASEVHATW